MIIPVRCFTCGKVIANKWDFYMQEVQNKKESSEEKTNKTEHKRFDPVQTNDILEKLGLKRQCCRRSMIAHVELMPII